MNETSLLIAHFVCTLFMVGLIWFVQVVHYPLMASVGPDQFPVYSKSHQSRTTWVVAPPMLLEVATGLGLFWYRPSLTFSPLFLIAAGLLAVIWLSTALWQVPIHQKLLDGFNEAQVRDLVRSNWLRTIAWTMRAVLIGLMLPWNVK